MDHYLVENTPVMGVYKLSARTSAPRNNCFLHKMYARNKPSQQQNDPCEFCHQKRKHAPHLYCSKGCADQAAMLCEYCHLKPKHGTYGYCGKSCAGMANSNSPPPAQYNVKAALPGLPQVTTLKGPAAAGSGRNTNVYPVLPKSQKQSTAAQQLARGQAANTAGMSSVGGPQAHVLGPSLLANQPAPPGPHGYVLVPPASQIPMPNGHTAKPAFINNASGKLGASHTVVNQAKDAVYSDECRIPGCGQPTHVDDDGPSEYCSMRHREEAVNAGIESPCIMCLALPQSSADYFCSRGCREDALSKV